MGGPLSLGRASPAFLGAAANLLFIEAMKRRNVVTCATIYRLNLAPAACWGSLRWVSN